MDVRLCDRGDLQVMFLGQIQVSINVPFGIDDDRFLCLLATDQPGGLGKVFVIDLSQQHPHVHSGQRHVRGS